MQESILSDSATGPHCIASLLVLSLGLRKYTTAAHGQFFCQDLYVKKLSSAFSLRLVSFQDPSTQPLQGLCCCLCFLLLLFFPSSYLSITLFYHFNSTSLSHVQALRSRRSLLLRHLFSRCRRSCHYLQRHSLCWHSKLQTLSARVRSYLLLK